MDNEISKWEYRFESFGSFWSGIKTKEIEEILNQWGEEGWEVVSESAFENYNVIYVVAKHPLTRETTRRRSMPQMN